jgi:hypothetical protein
MVHPLGAGGTSLAAASAACIGPGGTSPVASSATHIGGGGTSSLMTRLPLCVRWWHFRDFGQWNGRLSRKNRSMSRRLRSDRVMGRLSRLG